MKIGYRHWMMVAAGWLALTGCSDAMDPIPNPTPDPSPEVRREALSITTTLSGSAVQTKAAGSNLAAGDVLYAYIRQVKPQEGSPGYTAVGDPSVESWVKLTVKGASAAVNPTVTPNRESTSSFKETVYWDDFSTTEHDLRTEGHALQSYYGYCYNGNTGSFEPNKSEGTLTWQVAADQTGGYQTSDLLWSKAQTPVEYKHGSKDDPASHGTLTIPYTHAMSKVTVVVKTDGAFGETALGGTSAALTDVYLKGEMNAPDGKVVPDDTSKGTIQMHNTEAKTFEALMIPGLELTEELTLAQINNVANNNYKITITQKILDAWKDQLAEGKTTKPGVNYKLTLTVRKQSVNIVASLTDWVNVEATGEGIVRFANDVTNITGVTGGAELTDGSEVDVFWVKQTEGQTALSTVTKNNYATTSTYHATDKKWTNTPALYWDNGTDCYYFRGLAKLEGGAITSYKPASGSDDYSFDVEQGTDLLWATTPKHTGNIEGGGTQDYAEGVAINPRTGNVPLRFDHAMSQISFNLQTTEGADKVELDGATLSLAQVVKKGTIEPANGKITPSEQEGDKVVLPLTTDPSIVVPQTLTDEMILTIRLKNDVSTYKIALNKCLTNETGTAVTTWEEGKHYTYAITLKKEAVQLIAFVKNWEKVEVNGDANLDWD